MNSEGYQTLNHIHFFISHAFTPKENFYKLEDLRNSVTTALQNACDDVNALALGFTASPIIEMHGLTERLPGQIHKQLNLTNVGIIDISDNNPNVFYEYGYLRSRGIPCIVIKSRQSNQYRVPSDIQGEFILYYDDIIDVIAPMTREVASLLRSIVNSRTYNLEYLHDVWFPKEIQQVCIIVSSEQFKSEFASRDSQNYIFMDNLGDKDSVLEVSSFLAKHYSRSKSTIYPADTFDYRFMQENLVVIGGPGTETEGNGVCRRIMESLNSKISYSTECDRIFFRGDELVPSIDSFGRLTKDYGYFARIPNPFDPTKTVVLIHGVHTFGVLGAARAFSDHPQAVENMRKVMDCPKVSIGNQLAFECVLTVEVFPSGEVAVPSIDPTSIQSLN